jgi:hypothetical protein
VGRRLLTAIVVSAFAGSCASMRAPLANPTLLPDEALTLQYMLGGGCIPYLLNEKSETAAMQGLRLHLFVYPPLISFPDATPGPVWKGSYPGLGLVAAGRGSCLIVMHGSDVAAFRTAAQMVFRSRFGPAVDRYAQSGYAPVAPGQITGCHDGLRYTYNQERGAFRVELNRIADCATDPMLGFHPS